MTQLDAGINWWRPAPPARDVDRDTPSPLAFGALVAFTAILLLTPQTFIPALKVLRIAMLAGGLAVAVHMVDATVHRRAVLASSPEIAAALALLAWAVLTVPFSVWPGGSIALLSDQYVKAVIFFLLIATLVTTKPRVETLAWVLVACSIPLALIALKHYAAGVYLTSRAAAVQRIAGLSGLTGNPNDLALTLNMFIPIAGALLVLSRTPGRRALAALALLLSAPAVIVTFSRAGFLTLGAIVAMAVYMFVRRQRIGVVLAVFVIAASAVPFLPQGYIDRLSTITDIAADRTGSAQGRWTDLGLAARVAADNPVVGVGLGQDILALDRIRDTPTWRSVHNAFLEIAVDLGIPGLLLFAGILVASFRTVRRVERRAAREPALRDLAILACGVRVSLVAFIIGAFFAPVAYQFYFFCIVGLAVALKSALRTELRIQDVGAELAPPGAA